MAFHAFTGPPPGDPAQLGDGQERGAGAEQPAVMGISAFFKRAARQENPRLIQAM